MNSRHILLPTDFSANAQNAIDYAIVLFEKEKCIFFILNAYEVGPSGLSSTIGKAKNTRLFSATKEESERKMTSLLKKMIAKNENPLHQYKSLCIPDSLLNAIGKSTIDNNISYIFMGTKGSSAVKEVFMGSSTVSVLKNIDFCPVVAVPENYQFKIPEKIAFTTNFEHVYAKVELIPLTDLAKLWNSEINILHVDTGKKPTPQQETNKILLKKRLAGFPLRFIEVEGKTKISDTIHSFTRENNDIGMIAMVNYWHSFFEKLTKEHVINRVAFYTEIPFLIVPLFEP